MNIRKSGNFEVSAAINRDVLLKKVIFVVLCGLLCFSNSTKAFMDLLR